MFCLKMKEELKERKSTKKYSYLTKMTLTDMNRLNRRVRPLFRDNHHSTV